MDRIVVLCVILSAGCGRGEGSVLDPIEDAAVDSVIDSTNDAPDAPITTGYTITAGLDSTCVTRPDGSMWCWGENTDGALVPGGADLFVPTRIGSDLDWIAVSGMHGHCALKNDHRVAPLPDRIMQCWGPDTVPSGGSAPTPVDVAPTISWKVTSAGEQHHCGVDVGGTLRCWGANDFGQLGLGDTSPRTAVTALPGTWASASLGRAHTCAIAVDGTLSCWGTNVQGQLGLADRADRAVPTRVGARSDWRSVSSGFNHTCAIANDDSLWCWGENAYGEVGAGDTVVHDAPVHIGTFRAVSSGAGVSCAIALDGTLWCFGDFGQAPQPGQSHSPVQFDAHGDWQAIAAGRSHACGVRSGGGVLCLGWNFAGQLAQPKATSYSGTAIPVVF